MLVELARGNQQLLGRQTRISSAALNAWLTGKRFPSLALVIRLCQNLRVPINRLVMEEILRTDPEWSALAASGSLAAHRKQRVVMPLYPITRVVRLGSIPPEERERAAGEIKARLETNLAMDEPLSILKLFQIMGYRSTSRGKAWFPALCAATKAKRERQAEHRTETYRQELLCALTEEPPPTIAQVALRLGISVPQLYLRHTCRELCKALAARSPDRRRFQRTKTEEALRIALEEPPVPLVIVASRLRKDADRLRVVFPDLCQRLRTRHLEHRALEQQRVWLAYDDAVLLAIGEISNGGEYPSLERIVSFIVKRNPSLTSIHLTNLAVKRIRVKLKHGCLPETTSVNAVESAPCAVKVKLISSSRLLVGWSSTTIRNYIKSAKWRL